MFKYNGRQIRPGKGWVDDNGIRHPSNWNLWSAEEKAAYNIVELIPKTPPDSRLYKWYMDSDLKIHSTEKNLEDEVQIDSDGEIILDLIGNQVLNLGVKSVLKNQVKSQQGSLLSQTDWAIIRKADKGTAIPSNIQTWRDDIRTKATAMEDAINNAADTAAIEALFVVWNEDVGKSGILYDWPRFGD